MGRTRSPRAARVAVTATLVLSAAFATLGNGSAAALTLEPTGSVTVTLLGNGHGHGMSQYGARGAAIAGLSAHQIVAFYYPGTTLVTNSAGRIRVQLSGTGSRLTVLPADDLTVTGIDGPLPTAGVRQYRLVAGTGDGLWLEKRGTQAGAKWTLVQVRLPDGASFYRTGSAPVRVIMSNGTSRDYYGRLIARRTTASGAGALMTVNKVSLDDYAAGVVPEEVPTSWPRAAVNAQAIAARTYGAYAVDHPATRKYDICDTSWCQVYGGHAQYDSSGQLVWHDYPRAAVATAGQLLEYRGAAIFAQFSASDGGWTVDGGQPYLISHARPRGHTPLRRPARFGVGADVRVTYDPRRPTVVVLAADEVGSPLVGDLLWLLLGAGSLAGGLGVLVSLASR